MKFSESIEGDSADHAVLLLQAGVSEMLRRWAKHRTEDPDLDEAIRIGKACLVVNVIVQNPLIAQLVAVTDQDERLELCKLVGPSEQDVRH